MTDIKKLTDQQLSDKLAELGFPELKKLLSPTPSAGQFSIHAHVTDLKTFGDWLQMRFEECQRLYLTMTVEKMQESELYEWIFSHAAVLHEVLTHFQVATGQLIVHDVDDTANSRDENDSEL